MTSFSAPQSLRKDDGALKTALLAMKELEVETGEWNEPTATTSTQQHDDIMTNAHSSESINSTSS
jgi:hypothetical protein